MKKQILLSTKKRIAFSLVELIVVITILLILWTIAFISLQWFSKEARDAKRISDIRSLYDKIMIENAKWQDLSELIINTTQTTYQILWASWKTINTFWEINFAKLNENQKSFQDPSNWINYPIAFAEWHNWTEWYLFIQLATINEKEQTTKIIWNYYTKETWDAKSLFLDWETHFVEWWEKIYDEKIWFDDCGDWYFWRNSKCIANPNANHVFTNPSKFKFSKEAYPWCDTPNIQILDTDWKTILFELAACNVWAKIAGTHENCINSSTWILTLTTSDWIDCSTDKLWLHFQWSNNNWFTIEDEPWIWPSLTWIHVKGDTWESKAWSEPCLAGYHMPSNLEWQEIYDLWEWENMPSKWYKLRSDLFLPLAGYRYFIDGTLGNQSWTAYYWASSSSVDIINDAYNLFFGAWFVYPQHTFNIKSARSIRCIK